jgi:hypothetical protein
MSEILPAGRALPDLAADIRREVDAAEADYRSAVAHAIRAGELLIEAKAQVPHGGWLSWLEANTSVSDRHARRFMQLARNRTRVADLPSIREAVALLTEHAPEPEPATDADPDPEPREMLARALAEVGPEPRREDFDDDHIGGARHAIACIDWHRDRQDRACRMIVEEARQALSDPKSVAYAAPRLAYGAAMLAFHAAERRAERACASEWPEAHLAAGRALAALREAQWANDDALGRLRRPLFYRDADGAPDFQDCMYLAHRGLWPEGDEDDEPGGGGGSSEAISPLLRLLERQRLEADRYMPTGGPTHD